MKYLSGPLYRKYLKRLMDVVMSIVLLILFSPICAITAIAIKVTSPGPLFADVPERIGRNTKRFTMYKFRSMINNAHIILRTDPSFAKLFSEYKKGSYKLMNDPRVTKFGTIIRKHSIDEIPQLLNVLKGQMSIVGPRAYYKDELEDQQKKYPHTRALVKRVLSLNPGITGLWQVSGRSEINFDKRIALDASYVDNLSLWNDLKIILKTPLIMITGKGAV
jgi:lipopolysaccharide/colanic/teichoic acid biosynthesis glycosyltransferase